MGERGFTIVELLVSLLIFAMLSAAAVTLLRFSVEAQQASAAGLDSLSDLRRANALMGADFAQAVPRVPRDAAGMPGPAFEGGSGQGEAVVLSLVRRGWTNYEDAPRSSLQRVDYRLAGGRLERLAYPRVDGAAPLAAIPLVEDVEALRLRYRDAEGDWRERWDPEDFAALPRAVEVVVARAGAGEIRMVFLAGSGA
ncbi:MAG: type II secretion system minor pseudopilin GspJ [Sphingomonadaceae bacterium]